MVKTIGAVFIHTKILMDRLIFTVPGMIWMNHLCLTMVHLKKYNNEACQFTIFTSHKMAHSICICGFTMHMELFNKDQHIMVYMRETLDKIDHLCWLDPFLWEVRDTVGCGQVIVKLIGKMLKCRWIIYYPLVFQE